MNNYKIFRFLELLWLTIAICAALASAWLFHNEGLNQAKFPLFVTFVAGVLYGLRRYQRKRIFPDGENKKNY
jgi:hypothetical protein